MTSSQCYNILNDIRLSKGISVSALCEGIISDRSYFRLLKAQNNVRFDVFLRLAERLNVNVHEIVHYAKFIDRGDPQISRFIYRVHLHHYSDIIPIYEKVKDYIDEDQHTNDLLKAYIEKYQYSIGKCSKLQYHESLKQLYLRNMANGLPKNIYAYSLAALYASEIPHNDECGLIHIANEFLKLDYRMGVSFYIISLDLIIRSLLFNSTKPYENMSILISKYTECVSYFPHKFFHSEYMLFNAYNRFIVDGTDWQYMLIKYVYNAYLIYDKSRIEAEFVELNRLFKCDIKQLIDSKSYEIFSQDPFKLS